MQTRRTLPALAAAGLLVLPSSLQAGDAIALGSLSAYGNFHAAGVVVTVVGDDDRNATATLEWRPAGGTFRPAQPLARIDATHFVGSLFGLSPGTRYEARVRLSDPGGLQGASSGTVAFETRPDVLSAPTLRTLYVAPSGHDANAGTTASAPLRTIQRAADLAQAGDLILIQAGTYRESVHVRRSGTATQPIVFRGGAGVVLDGADAQIAAGVPWIAAGSGVYTRVLGFATDQVVSNLGRLYRYASLADLQALAAGPPGGFFFDGSQLHLKFSDGSSPAGRTLHVARREDAFLLDGVSHVRVENVEIRHYGSAGYGKGVYLRYASSCAVRKSRIHEVESAGVWVKGGDRHLIEDNEIWDTSIFGWPWPLVKGSRAENTAIRFTNEFGRGHVIRRNVVHGTFNGIAPGGATGPATGLTNETDVYDNVLYAHTDDAFEPEGYGANLRFWPNRIQDVHMPFSVAPVAPGPVYLLRNVAFRFGNTRTSRLDGYTASVLKVNSGYPTVTGPLFLYHNTFLTDVPGTNAVTLLTPGSGTSILARNNLFAGTRYVLEKSNKVALDWNGDDFHTTDTTRFVKWDSGVRYPTLGALRGGTGQEAEGLSAPPLLTDPGRGDFRPRPNSPLVNRALLLPGINDTYLGPAPDVGALEAASLPSVSIADVTVTEGHAGTVSASFTVSLSAPATATVTVDYASADGTATVADGDYAGTTGTVSLAPGQTSTRVDVGVKGDTRPEPDETIFLQLTNASGATLADDRAQAAIANDDAPAAAAVATEPVVWTRASGVSVLGNSLTKTAAIGWGNAGAVSTKSLVSGDGYVEFMAQETNTHRMLGLGNWDSNLHYADIDFAIHAASGGVLQVYEAGVLRGTFGNYAAGDKLRVSVSSGRVKYSRNGIEFRTSPVTAKYPLLVDTALYSTGATLAQGVVSGNWVSPPPPPPPSALGAPVVLFTDVPAGPTRGGPGNLGVPIALFGKGFGSSRGTSTVTINGVEVARYLVWGRNNANNPALDMIVVQPGPTATAGPIVVRVNGRDSAPDHSFTPTSGAVYHVSPTGSDTASCSESSPCRTILYVATSRMQAGDALLVRGGNLADNEIWIRDVLGHSGQPGRPKIIRNLPGEQPVFVNASRPFILEANHIVVSGFHFTGGKSINVGNVANKGNRVVNNTFRGAIGWDAVGAHGDDHLIAGNDCSVTSSSVGTQGHCYYISHSRNLRILYNVGRGAPGYGIHVFDQRRSVPDIQRVIANVLVEGNLLASSPLRSGMIVAMQDEGGLGNRVDGVTIRNNMFVGSNHMGLVIGGLVRNVQVYNNTFYKNGRQGIHVIDDPGVDGITIRNNLIDQTANSNCTSNCEWFQDAHIQKGTRARNVIVANNYYAPGPARLIGTTDSAPTAGLAGFINGDGLDFHLRDGSPAIDKGAVIVSVVRDFDGRRRPSGTTHDPGAFEHP